MSKLNDLLNELCPNGVEYKTLGEIGTLTRGKRFVHADAVDDGIPCIHYGELYTYYGTSTNTTKSFVRRELANKLRYAKKNDVIIVGAGENDWDIGVAVAYLGEEEVAIHDACYIFRQDNDPQYISYCLRTTDYHQQIKKYVSTGKICALSATGLSKARIPVPPLEVQREVVRMLDSFTLLMAELTAELTARKKQYEYYKNVLLSTSYKLATTQDVKKESFWLMPATPQYKEDGVPYITSKNIKNGTIDFCDTKFISDEDYYSISSNRSIMKNDLLITMIGTIGEAAFVEEDTKFYGQNIYLVRLDEKKINRKYYYYFLTSSTVRNSLVSKKNTSSQGYIKAGSIEELRFPLPDMDTQNTIVRILENFDRICYDKIFGLPAEIDARQKQFEYYRDKLLSFKELTA